MTPEELASKGKRTRAELLEAAYDLFLRQGYSATSMRQIAKRAGIALGGIYNHFASKDEIFQALIVEKHPYLYILPVLQEAPGENAEEFIRNAARLIAAKMGPRPDFIKLLFIEIVEFEGRHFPKVMEAILPHSLPLIQRFVGSDDSLRQDIHVLKLVRIFIGNIVAFYLTGYLLGGSELPPELSDVRLEDFMEVFMHGVLQPRA